MELDDFKSAWQSLDRRLQRDDTLKLHELRERKLDKARELGVAVIDEIEMRALLGDAA